MRGFTSSDAINGICIRPSAVEAVVVTGHEPLQLDDVLLQIPPITEVKAAKVLKEKRICEDARRGRLVVQCQSKGLRGEDRRCSRVFAFSHEANSVAWVGERKKDGP